MGTSGKLSTVSTLGFSSNIHRLPQDFWTKGVDKSKFILETILNKIKYFEEVTESTWIDFVKENFALDSLREGNYLNTQCVLKMYQCCWNWLKHGDIFGDTL